MEKERSIVLFEDHKKIFGRMYHIRHDTNNLEKDLAEFIYSMGKEKGMINPMRVANRLSVLCGRANPFIAAVDIIRHPDDWKFKKIRLLEDEAIPTINESFVVPQKSVKNPIKSDVISEV